MKNKQTIAQAHERQRLLILRIARYANELKDLDSKIAKMRSGKIKQPAPPGKKHMITTESAWATPPLPDDDIPDFLDRR